MSDQHTGKSILIIYYNEELSINSTNSVTRLVSSLAIALSAFYEITCLTFDTKNTFFSKKIIPFFLKIPKPKIIFRAINNRIRLKRIKWFTLKRETVINSLAQLKSKNFDAIIILGLDDVKSINSFFPTTKKIYWIHNISALCNKAYLANINLVQYFISPSRTTYKFLLDKLQPKPLTAIFYFMPNWIAEIFMSRNINLISSLREKYNLPENEKVFIFCGGDLKLKGRFIIEKAIEKFSLTNEEQITFIFAGGQRHNEDFYFKKIRLIYVGILQPEQLAIFYKMSKFGCFPSLAYDHCPLTLLEMIHCNVLPIASNIGGVKELLGEDYLYLVNEPHSVTNWIKHFETILKLTDDEIKGLINSLKQNISNYRIDKAVEVIENIMND